MTWNPSLIKCGAAMITAGLILAIYITRDILYHGSWSKFTRYFGAYSTSLALCCFGMALPLDSEEYPRIAPVLGNLIAIFLGLSMTCCIIIVLRISGLLHDSLQNSFKKVFILGARSATLVRVVIAVTSVGSLGSFIFFLTGRNNESALLMATFLAFVHIVIIICGIGYIRKAKEVPSVSDGSGTVYSTFHLQKRLTARLLISLAICYPLFVGLMITSVIVGEFKDDDSPAYFLFTSTAFFIAEAKETVFFLCQKRGIVTSECMGKLVFKQHSKVYLMNEKLQKGNSPSG